MPPVPVVDDGTDEVPKPATPHAKQFHDSPVAAYRALFLVGARCVDLELDR